jgi:geranylgeranyl transferase type-1 subunit beta
MRFVFTVSAVSTLINDWSGIDIEKTVSYIKASLGYEFAFGQGPGQESHGGSTYCAVAALALMNRLDALGFSYDVR